MSATIVVSWGDAVLRHQVVEPRGRFVVGAAVAADFVAPVETHVVRVHDGGGIQIEAGGSSRALHASGSERIALGPIRLSVARSRAERKRFRSATWLFDLGGVASIALYAGFAGALTLPARPSGASAEPLEYQQYLLKTVFSHSSEEAHDAAAATPSTRQAEPTTLRQVAIYAETKARSPSTRPRNQGVGAPRTAADERRGGTGARSQRDEGAIGHPHGPPLVGTWAMLERDSTRLAANRDPRRSATYGIGQPQPAEEEDTLTADWEEETDDSGEDDRDVVGNMYGDEPVDPTGTGLGVSDTADGGGGNQPRRVGTGQNRHGHGEGHGSRDGRGVLDAALFRRDVGLASHSPSVPSFATQIPPEVVERVLARARQSLRACGAKEDFVELVIGVAGLVTHASSSNACVVRVLSGLRFLPAGTQFTRVHTRLGT